MLLSWLSCDKTGVDVLAAGLAANFILAAATLLSAALALSCPSSFKGLSVTSLLIAASLAVLPPKSAVFVIFSTESEGEATILVVSSSVLAGEEF